MMTLKRLSIALTGTAALTSLAACQSSEPPTPITTYSVRMAAVTPQPKASAVYVTAQRRAGPRINEFGGEIPKAAPAVPVGEGGLGEIR